MIEVGKHLTKFVGIRIPEAQEREGKQVAKEKRVAIGLCAVDSVDDAHTSQHDGAAFKQTQGIVHSVPEEADEQGSEERIDEGDKLDAEGTLAGGKHE